MPKSVDDPKKPICRHFMKGKCHYRDRCRFYHPQKTTRTIEKRTKRRIGYCYCGSSLKTIMNYTPIRDEEDQQRALFFKVCSKTGRSMKRCFV